MAASEKSCTAAALVDELIAAKKKDGASERHVSDLNSRLNIFAEKFDGQPVATFTTKEIDDWLRSLNVAPVTRNHYRRLIVLAFSVAVRRGYTTSNPAKDTGKAKEPQAGVGILAVSQTARLLEAASPELLPYVATGAFAGLRRAEIERLDWNEIDFESGLIEVTAEKSKTAQRRFVTIQPNLHEWLMPLRKVRGNVTPRRWDFRQAFDQAREASWHGKMAGQRAASFVCELSFGAFQNAAALALEMGYTNSGMIFEHYRQLVRPKEAEAVLEPPARHVRKSRVA